MDAKQRKWHQQQQAWHIKRLGETAPADLKVWTWHVKQAKWHQKRALA